MKEYIVQAIEQEIVSECKNYDMLSLAFDPMQATQMSQNLISNGVPMVELFQNLKNYSEPMKQLQALIYAERIHFSDNPVMHWMMSNVVCHMDAKENIFPRKEKNEQKIDGPVALIMAMNQSIQLNVEKQIHSRNLICFGLGLKDYSATIRECSRQNLSLRLLNIQPLPLSVISSRFRQSGSA